MECIREENSTLEVRLDLILKEENVISKNCKSPNRVVFLFIMSN